MSAKKYLTSTLFLLSFLGSFSTFSQNELVAHNDLKINEEEPPQFLVRTKQNGKVKYVECALPNLYFHRATATISTDESVLKENEFTAKGGTELNESYFGYTFFLIQDGVIKACNETGDFKNLPGGVYTVARYSYPLSIAPESFNGKDFNTIENHPLFEKDANLQNFLVRLLGPKLTDPVLPKQPVISSEEIIFGLIQSDFPASN